MGDTMVTMEIFNPRRLIALRRAAGFASQGALADRLGVTRQAVNNWETGLYAPSARALPGLVRALGCKLEDLYGPDLVPVRS